MYFLAGRLWNTRGNRTDMRGSRTDIPIPNKGICRLKTVRLRLNLLGSLAAFFSIKILA